MSAWPPDPSELPRKRAAAGTLLTNDAGHLLLVNPIYKERWEVPGGLVEDGESPREAARRECVEELGVEVEVGRLLVVGYDDRGRTPGDSLHFVFDGVLSSTAFKLQASEVDEAAFVLPDQLHSHLTEPVADRMLAALEARGTGQTIYLERGVR